MALSTEQGRRLARGLFAFSLTMFALLFPPDMYAGQYFSGAVQATCAVLAVLGLYLTRAWRV